jgi:hypothetical protein
MMLCPDKLQADFILRPVREEPGLSTLRATIATLGGRSGGLRQAFGGVR